MSDSECVKNIHINKKLVKKKKTKKKMKIMSKENKMLMMTKASAALSSPDDNFRTSSLDQLALVVVVLAWICRRTSLYHVKYSFGTDTAAAIQHSFYTM